MFCVSRIVPVKQPELDPAVADVNCKQKVRHGKFRMGTDPRDFQNPWDLCSYPASLPFLKGVIDLDDSFAAVPEKHQGIIG